ncbi:MAG: phytoene/squalene synthase family protein, partial [Chloroflexota bacterium]
TQEHVASNQVNDRWREFMRFQIRRTRRLYADAWPGIAMLDAGGQLAVAAAASLYQGILDDIEAHDYDVFNRRARVGDWKKLQRLARVYLQLNMDKNRRV